MPPNVDKVRHGSSLDMKYPTNRDLSFKTGDFWLDGKRTDDGAEGLWRVHDKLYDVSDFIDKHPGGSMWLKLTKGTDVTEAFEVHHLSDLPTETLKKYYIRDARTPRNSPFTFEEDGFYKTLRRRVLPMLKDIPKESIRATDIMIDAMFIGMFTFAILANVFWSYTFAVLSGALLACGSIASHNYFHKKDNWRMYYFGFCMLQFREWRITHVLSHHLFPNTIQDFEISFIEPWIEYLPKQKTFAAKYLSIFYAVPVWIITFHLSYFKRFVQFCYFRETRQVHISDIMPLILPTVMYIASGQPLLPTFGMWTFIICFSSLWACIVGFNGAHHHPDIFHDGDTPRSKTKVDWAVHQLDAVADRYEISGSPFLVLTNFGDHALHHMFPSVDHGALKHLYPVFYETMEEFGLGLRMKSQLDMIKGQFKQLAREKPNPNPPILK